MFRAAHNSLISLLYPSECHVCSNAVDDVDAGIACPECWTKARFFDGSEMLCARCGMLLGDHAAPAPVRCHRCEGHFYESAASLGIYEGALAAAIVNLKTSPVLPDRIISAIQAFRFAKTDLLIPIPLSKQRRLERGFNQAEVIAAAISRATNTPIDAGSLTRKVHSQIHRVGMDDKARDLSVRNAFEVVRPNLIRGKEITLIDDVLTSGSTASHCAKILKKHGSAAVTVFTLARAVMRNR